MPPDAVARTRWRQRRLARRHGRRVAEGVLHEQEHVQIIGFGLVRDERSEDHEPRQVAARSSCAVDPLQSERVRGGNAKTLPPSANLHQNQNAIGVSVGKQSPGTDYRANAHAHLRATLLGRSIAVGIRQGELALGRFQSIVFAELDGPRKRKISVQVIGE